MQRVASKDHAKNLELLSAEVSIPGGVTALVRASQYADLVSMKKLVALGVDVNFETSGGLTALSEACKIASIEAVTYLVRNGADINYRNRFNETLFCIPLGSLEVVPLFVGYLKIRLLNQRMTLF